MTTDPRESSSYNVTPRIRYNTIGGVNGPLVILESVGLPQLDVEGIEGLMLWCFRSNSRSTMRLLT